MSSHAAIRHLKAARLWRADGWQADAGLAVDADGCLQASTDAAGESIGQWVLPGMPNLHSHAFQRAMAGLAERKGRVDDSFWSWRETMYAFAAKIGPDELKAIAAQLYVEMLKAGYTRVCEFHYLHHQPDGTPYAQPEAMSLALDRGGARGRHRADLAAGAVHQRRFRRPRAECTSAPLRPCRRRLPAPAGILAWTARRRSARRHRTAFAARGAGSGAARGAGQRAGAERTRSTSISPNRSARYRTAWLPAVRGRWNGCSTTPRSMPAGAWCMPPTSPRRRPRNSPAAVPLPACVPPPRRIWVTACFRWRPIRMPVARSASVRIRTSRFRRWKNCAGWNTASA